jgi:hypothetical protein
MLLVLKLHVCCNIYTVLSEQSMFAPRFSDIYSFGKVRSEVSCYEDLHISEEEEDENYVVME